MRSLKGIVVCLAVLALLSAAEAGACRNCGLVYQGTATHCADCARRFAVERERAMKELVHVERVAKARREYQRSMADLVEYYLEEGIAQKVADARREQQDLKTVRTYDYLSLAELLGADLTPKRSIAEAETLFRDGLNYYEHFAWPWQKAERYALAVEKFKELVRKYPESDRIDDAAYYLGRCYEKKHFKEYRRAVAWHQRCFQWNPKTTLDPRYRIARVYDYQLGQRDKAIMFYNLVVRDGASAERAEKAQERVASLRRTFVRERTAAVTMPEED